MYVEILKWGNMLDKLKSLHTAVFKIMLNVTDGVPMVIWQYNNCVPLGTWVNKCLDCLDNQDDIIWHVVVRYNKLTRNIYYVTS